MSSLVTVNLLNTNSVKYGSVPIQRIMRGSTQLWTGSVFPYIRYDSASGKYYNVTGISQDGTQYVQTELEPYYLVQMLGRYDYPLGVYASINTVIELWCTRLQDFGDCTISNAWNMNDSTGSWRIFAWDGNSSVCLDFGSDSYSNSNSKANSGYMVRLKYDNARDLLDGTSGDTYHMKVGNIDNRAKQIVYRNGTQVCNNQSNTLRSFYRGTDAEAQFHLYHRKDNDNFTFYKVIIRQDGEVVRNIYWKKDTNDNLYLYDSVTDSVIQPTSTNGTLTYQTGKDTYTLHDDIGPVTDYYYADGTITVNGVIYDRLVNNLDNTKIIRGIQK